jgi:hypothetical protein
LVRYGRKYEHPPAAELSQLYIKEDYSSQELADHFNLPKHIITYLLLKYHIRKDSNWRGQKSRRDKMEIIKKKGLTKEKLHSLYIDEQLSISKIAKMFNEHWNYISLLMGMWEIPKRSPETNKKLIHEQLVTKKAEEKKTFIQKKVEAIREDIKSGNLDVKDIDHQKACMLISCSPGIEKLKIVSDIYGFNFQILANTYKKMEKVWFKFNLYPKIEVKIAIVLHLRYKINQTICSQIAHVSDVSFRTYFNKIKDKIRLTRERREDPLTVVNIRWLFDNPNLPEQYPGLKTLSMSTVGYYCNLRNENCENYSEWNTRCYKPSFYSCFYSFTKYAKRVSNVQ